jgi:adenine specific DNA methylase Mod
MENNILYYGDNLEIIRKYFPDNSIDLIYLDPPFNSNAAYNILFKEPTGEPSQAQITAFDDTWHWSIESERTFQEIITNAPINVAELITAFRNFIHQNDMMAYLVMMCIRLLELKRVLKLTGSIYLHCDSTASHYLKILMDAVFGIRNFRNEIIWRRTGSNSAAKRFGPIHQTILYYAKSNMSSFYPVPAPYTKGYIDDYFTEQDERGSYRPVLLTGPGTRKGDSGKAWHSYDPTKSGRHWQPASYIYTKYRELTGDDLSNYPLLERLDRLDEIGLIHWAKKEGGGVPNYKYYQLDAPGVLLQDIWAYQPGTEGCVYGKPSEGIDQDVKWLSTKDKERLGYPTQKPEGILERIIKSSSKEGDLVLDPFCGCGTTVVVANKLNRKWIGIDITHLAITTMKWRLEKIFPGIKYKTIGEPKDLAGAQELAKNNKYQFQWWAVSLVGGQPYGDKKKGADTGIDGYLYFMDEKDKVKKAIISVKGGGTSVKDIRDLGHVIDREKADLGIFITLEQPTGPMGTEAVTKGFYHSPLGEDYPRMQILTIEDLFNGKKPNVPPWIAPIQKPPKYKQEKGKTAKLF